jgi:allantoin racemase
VRDSFEAQGMPLVEAGAEILIPAGGIPMLLFSAIKGHRVGDAPVINGIPIVVKQAELAVKLRELTGLQVSRAGDYIKAPPEIIEEFMAHPKGL